MITLIGLFVFGIIDIQTELSPEFTSKQLTIGEPVGLNVTLRYDQTTQVSPPIVDSLGAFAVIDIENDVTEEDGYVMEEYTIRLAPFSTGKVKIPQFKFLVKEGETVDTVLTDSFPLEIVSTLPEDMTDINGLKGPVEYPDYLPFILGAVIAGSGVLAWVVWRFLRRVQKMRVLAKPLPPPWIEALVALENIPAKEWIGKGLVKRYYYSLSEILKRYLERRFEFSALEQTTTEIVHHLKARKVLLRDEFTQFFAQTDLVKYAKFVPALDDQQEAVERAKGLINKTKPIEREGKR